MWPVLVLSAVGVTVVALRIFFALKTAHTARKELDANRGEPLSDADSRGRTGIEVAVSPIISSETIRDKSVRKEMWVDSQYCWVVVCKNHWRWTDPSSGMKMGFHGFVLWRFEGDKIAERWATVTPPTEEGSSNTAPQSVATKKAS